MGEQQLRQTVSALDIRRAQMENLTRQQEIIRASLEEHMRAKETLESYSKSRDENQLLVPIGAGVFIHVLPGKRETAIGGVGSSVLIERSVSDISKLLDDQIDELKKNSKVLGEEAEKIAAAIEELSVTAQRQYEALQQRGQQNVAPSE